MFPAIIAILGGLIAASSLIVSKKPNAQELLDKITPYQGWIGVLLMFWGIRGVFFYVFKYFSIQGILISGLELAVGFLLAYGLISKYVLEKNEEAKEKGQLLRSKLVKYQVPAGIALAVLGVLSILRIF